MIKTPCGLMGFSARTPGGSAPHQTTEGVCFGRQARIPTTEQQTSMPHNPTNHSVRRPHLCKRPMLIIVAAAAIQY